MMARVYLAAGYGRRAEMLELTKALHVAGHEVVSRWIFGTHETPEIAARGIADDQPAPAEGASWADEDLEDVLRCDVLVAFTDGPRIVCEQCEGTGRLECDGQPYDCYVCKGTGGDPRPWQRGGRHVEFGLALAWSKHLIVAGPREHVFHWLPQVRWVDCAAPESWERRLLGELAGVEADRLRAERQVPDWFPTPPYETSPLLESLPLPQVAGQLEQAGIKPFPLRPSEPAPAEGLPGEATPHDAAGRPDLTATPGPWVPMESVDHGEPVRIFGRGRFVEGDQVEIMFGGQPLRFPVTGGRLEAEFEVVRCHVEEHDGRPVTVYDELRLTGVSTTSVTAAPGAQEGGSDGDHPAAGA
jgi:hypothetical protein